MKVIRQIEVVGLSLALALSSQVVSLAGEWKEVEQNAWIWEEAGEAARGWIYVNGFWYYMDEETGLWQEAPPLNRDTVCYLLENAVKRAGWYRDEEARMVYKVDRVEKNHMTVSIVLETSPEQYSSTLNSFDIDIRNRTAKSQQAKLTLALR